MESEVRGVLAWTLYAARALGLAPLRLTRAHAHRAGAGNAGVWSASAAPQYEPYNYLLFLAIITSCVVALIFGIGKDDKFESVEIFIWTIEAARVTSILVAGVFCVRLRMEAIIRSLHMIEKIHVQYNSDRCLNNLDKKEKILMGVTIMNVAFCLGQTLYYVHRGIMVLALQIATHTLLFLMMVLLTLQFAQPALRVTCALAALNHSIRSTHYLTHLQTMGSSDVYTIPIKSVNIAVDSLSVEKQVYGKECCPNEEIAGRMRRLTLAHEAAQEAVHELNNGFGFVMALIYAFFLIYITLEPYLIVKFIARNPLYVMDNIEKTCNFIMHATLMLLGVQPGHEIEQEAERTRRLVGQLLGRAPACGRRAACQLGAFYRQLALVDLSYSPLGLFKLSRPLILSIIATSVTLTVVFLQVQGLQV